MLVARPSASQRKGLHCRLCRALDLRLRSSPASPCFCLPRCALYPCLMRRKPTYAQSFWFRRGTAYRHTQIPAFPTNRDHPEERANRRLLAHRHLDQNRASPHGLSASLRCRLSPSTRRSLDTHLHWVYVDFDAIYIMQNILTSALRPLYTPTQTTTVLVLCPSTLKGMDDDDW